MTEPQDPNHVCDADGQLLEQTGDEQVGLHLRFRVGASLRFRRLDKYLCGRFSQFSRSRLQKLIKDQGVNVNGRPAKPSHKLNPRDEIDLVLPPREVRELIPEDIPLDILHEDADVIVVNKQADLIVHPARSHRSGTLVNGLRHQATVLNTLPTVDLSPDPDDNPVLAMAETSQAQYLVTGDKKDLLALGTIGGTRIVTARQFVDALGI